VRIPFTTGLREELGKLVPMAVVGVGLGVTSAMIALDHPVEPLDVPLPVYDTSELAKVAASDRTVRARADHQPFPAEIRAIGSAFLDWNAAAAAGTSPDDPQREQLALEMRSALGVARAKFGGEKQLEQPMGELRAYHAEYFIEELHRYERTGAPSKELSRLAGGLLPVLQRNGWLGPRGALLAPEAILRARYKLHWTGIVFNLEECESAPPPLCYGLTTLPLAAAELTALLAYLVEHPVVREADLVEAGTPERAIDRRRLVYVDRLSAIDRHVDPSGRTHPYLGSYPLPLARGVLLFRLGRYEQAREELGRYAAAHPHDARARNWFLGATAKMQGH
jgi:hypothetical protein